MGRVLYGGTRFRHTTKWYDCVSWLVKRPRKYLTKTLTAEQKATPRTFTVAQQMVIGAPAKVSVAKTNIFAMAA